ncbi:hypothetical protein HYV81_05935 [Candidatus Woesearchaeota archaeon]|nr:hypothetical protein [Candidatus Woesearchaeota archaeon]
MTTLPFQSLYAECAGYMAPFYNLVLVVIVLILFVKLFLTPNRKVYLEPWKWLFYALLIYIAEELLTIADASGVAVSDIVYPFLETLIIACFIYMLLLQRAYTKYNKF